MGSSFKFMPRRFLAKTSCGLMSESAPRRAPGLGSETEGDQRAAKSIPEERPLVLPRRVDPKYGNLCRAMVATRAIHKVVYENELGH